MTLLPLEQGARIKVFAPAWLAAKQGIGTPQEGTVEICTPKAVLLAKANTDTKVWLPLSQITWEPVQSGQAAAVAEIPDEPVPYTRTTPWEHQRRAFWFAFEKRAAMLALDMGTGKSAVATWIMTARHHKRILILCPSAVVDVWPSEIAKHSTRDILCIPLRGSVSERVHMARQALRQGDLLNQPVVLVTNYEGAWREPFGPTCDSATGKVLAPGFALDAGFDLVVLDESHKVKSPSGVASKFCARLGAKTDYRLCLTGTPMPHSPLDIYGQYRFLDPSIYGSSYHRFVNRYAQTDPMFRSKVLRYLREDELNARFFSIAFRVMKGDVLDLPPVMHVDRYCALEPDAARIYQSLEEDLMAQVGTGVITVSNALVKLLRLQQLTGGYLPLLEAGDAPPLDVNGWKVDSWGQMILNAFPKLVKDKQPVTMLEVSKAKRDLLAEVLDDLPLDEPVVVFARFSKDLDAIREVALKAGRSVGELSGRRKDLAAWQAGEYNVLAVQVKTGEAGISLVRARYHVYYSKGFSRGDYDQSLARGDRPGQTRSVMYIHLLVEGTVDVKVQKALVDRKKVIDFVLGYDRDDTSGGTLDVEALQHEAIRDAFDIFAG